MCNVTGSTTDCGLWSEAVQPVPPLAGDESYQIAGLSPDVTPPLSAFVPPGQLTVNVAFELLPRTVGVLVATVRPGTSSNAAQITDDVADELDGSNGE